VALATPSALAVQRPQVPPSAGKLTAAQIKKLYDGNTFSFTSYTTFGAATGRVSYDFESGTNHVDYQLGSHHGSLTGTIRLSGDKFCYKVGFSRERCDDLYLAGSSIYDVDADGTVESLNQSQ
jgi:hypothetical protein